MVEKELIKLRIIHNERKLLKLLVNNSKLSDTAIAEKLRISTQAIGKMRKKLENAGLIKKYVVNLDYSSLGIEVFSVTVFKLSSFGLKYYGASKNLLNDLSSNLVMLFQSGINYIAVHAFRSLRDLDYYFQVFNSNFSKIVNIQNIWSFSTANILKKSLNPIFCKVLEEYGAARVPLPEICIGKGHSDPKLDDVKPIKKLTENERLVLQGFLNNGKINDATISRRLGLSTRAVGKIRAKLEKVGLIRGYNSALDFEKLGINVFAILMLEEKGRAWEKFSDDGINYPMLFSDNITHCFQTPDGGITKILICAFRNIKELDFFVNKLQSSFHDFFELKSVYISPHTSLLKNDISDLFLKNLNEFGSKKLALSSPDVSRLNEARKELNSED